MSKLDEQITAVVQRTGAFYQRTEPGHYLIGTRIPVELPSIPPLSNFDLDHQLSDWLDCKLVQSRAVWRAKEGLVDDMIPAICPTFGIAEHSAWLGMDVILQEDTCLPVPVIFESSDLKKLRLSETDRWFGYMKDGYDYLRRQKDGSFVLSVRGAMTPMEIANAVRGDELFIDFLEQPEFVHSMLTVLVEALRWYFPRLCSWADYFAGSHVFAYGMSWMPPGTIGHLANDAAMLCSADIYAEFGFPYEVQLVEGYQQVLYHVHNEKMHYVPQLVKLPGMALLEVTNDPTAPSTADDLARIFAATGSANLMLMMTSGQVRDHLDELGSRNVFLQVECQDRLDAEDIIAFVRDRSKAL
jgi:hypothetical protein